MEQIKNIFLKMLGEPTYVSKLDDYISFCLSHSGIFENYCENHHILPRSKFKEYEKETWNIVKLSYDNHMLAHFKLIEAYPLRSFTRPLTYLRDITEDQKILLREATSIAAKKWWEELKQDSIRYTEFVEVRKKWIMENGFIGSEYHKSVCDGVQKYYEEHPERRQELSEFFKQQWELLSDDEYAQRRKNMSWKDSDNYVSRCESIKQRYEDEEYYDRHVEIMTQVNKDENKRKAAGKTISKNWEDDEYRAKVMSGRENGNKMRKERGEKRSNSATMKEKWADPVWRQYMLDKRKHK